MIENVLKFLNDNKVVLWLRTSNSENIENELKKNFEIFKNQKVYIYERGRTLNQNNKIEELEMNTLFNTFDKLYLEGIRKTPILLIIKNSIEETLQKNNLEYIKEIIETKENNPKYNFKIIILTSEKLPLYLENLFEVFDETISNLSKFKKTFSFFKNKLIKSEDNKRKYENMSYIKGGKYIPSFCDKEKIVLNLEVSKYLITQDIWKKIMGYNPSYFKEDKRPVERVTWWDTLEFCNRLSEKYKLDPVYDLSDRENEILLINELDGEKKLPDKADFGKTEGFRLPTEIEWEWFARGGQKALDNGTFDYKYSGSNNIDEVAWYCFNSRPKKYKQEVKLLNPEQYNIDELYWFSSYDGEQTQEVGLKKPNQLGLYDCNGNVWEWCYDPEKYSLKEPRKILRGGSWKESEDYCDITNRYSYYSNKPYYIVGFRIVRTLINI